MLSFQSLTHTLGSHMPQRILESQMCKSNGSMKNESLCLSRNIQEYHWLQVGCLTGEQIHPAFFIFHFSKSAGHYISFLHVLHTVLDAMAH